MTCSFAAVSATATEPLYSQYNGGCVHWMACIFVFIAQRRELH